MHSSCHYPAIFRINMKYMNIVWIVVLFFIFFLKWTLSIHFVPERARVTRVDEKYVYNVSADVVRYGRKSTYYVNLLAGLKHTWGNNITVHLTFFESKNNQFKSTFVEIHLKMCDFLQHDPYFGALMRRVLGGYGVSCPMAPGMYRFMNMSLPAEDLPNFLPFQKGKVDITYSQLPTSDVVCTVEIYFSVKK